MSPSHQDINHTLNVMSVKDAKDQLMDRLKRIHKSNGTEAAVIRYVIGQRKSSSMYAGKKGVIMDELTEVLAGKNQQGHALKGRRQELIQRVFDLCGLTATPEAEEEAGDR